MFLSVAYVLLVGTPPAAADPAQECFLDYLGSVPLNGAADVPVDSIFRVELDGWICTPEPLVLTITEAGQELAPIEVSVDLQLGWFEFPEVDLQPNTVYSADFDHPDGRFSIQFATGEDMAALPQAPNLQLTSATAPVLDTNGGRTRVDAVSQAFNGDSSGNSTLILITPDGWEQELQTPNGRVEHALSWVEDTPPAEACVTAITVSPSGERSEPIVACRHGAVIGGGVRQPQRQRLQLFLVRRGGLDDFCPYSSTLYS